MILRHILEIELLILDEELNSLEMVGVPKDWKKYWNWRRHRKRIVQETLERYWDIKLGKRTLQQVCAEIKENAMWLKERETKHQQ